MQADSRKVDRQTASQHDTSFGRLHELRNVGVAWIEARVCVDDSDDWFRECVVAVAGCFDEDFSEKEGEVGIAVRCEALPHARTRLEWFGEVVIGSRIVVFRIGPFRHLLCTNRHEVGRVGVVTQAPMSNLDVIFALSLVTIWRVDVVDVLKRTHRNRILVARDLFPSSSPKFGESPDEEKEMRCGSSRDSVSYMIEPHQPQHSHGAAFQTGS